jgi:hypothetical protein
MGRPFAGKMKSSLQPLRRGAPHLELSALPRQSADATAAEQATQPRQSLSDLGFDATSSRLVLQRSRLSTTTPLTLSPRDPKSRGLTSIPFVNGLLCGCGSP